MRDALIGLDATKAILAAAWLTLIFRNLAMLGFFAYRWKEGLWGNIILAFNFLFSTLIAVNYWEPLTKMLDKSAPIGLFFWDSLAFACLFLVSFILFTIITDKISRVIVVFPPNVEKIGNTLILGFIIGTMILPMYFFFLMIAPVAPIPVAGARSKKDEARAERTGLYPENAFLLAPYKYMSSSSLSCLKETNTFNPNNDFVERHEKRRCMFFKNLWEKGQSAYKGETNFIN